MRANIRFAPSLGGKSRVNDDEFVATMQNGFSATDVLETCEKLEIEVAQRGFPIEELVNNTLVSQRASQIIDRWASKRSLARLAADQFEDSTTRRVWCLEYLIAAQNGSMLQLNKDYVKAHGKIGVSNPVDNIILKTKIGRSITTKQNIYTLCDQICGLIKIVDTPAIEVSSLVAAVQQYRIKSLLLQPYLNPTRVKFESLCLANGIKAIAIAHASLLNDIGLTGRGTRIEEIYKLKIGNKIKLVKVLSGYRGGYEHKADEMSARGWLLKFRKLGANFKSLDQEAIFVYEGEWDKYYLNMMINSGWDRVLPLVSINRNFNLLTG